MVIKGYYLNEDMFKTITYLFDMELDIKTSFNICNIMNELTNINNTKNEKIKEVISKYKGIGSTDDNIIIEDDKVNEFNSCISDIENMEFECNIEPINIDDLDDSIKIKPSVLRHILFIFV